MCSLKDAASGMLTVSFHPATVRVISRQMGRSYESRPRSCHHQKRPGIQQTRPCRNPSALPKPQTSKVAEANGHWATRLFAHEGLTTPAPHVQVSNLTTYSRYRAK